MATATPHVQDRNQFPRDWGNYASLSVCPKAVGYPGALNLVAALEQGDRAYIIGVGPCHCVSAGTPAVLDAVWALDTAVERIEVDFGSTGVPSASFVIVDPSVTASTRIVAWESAETATGRVGVDQEWDQLLLATVAAAGTFTLYATAVPGPVVGKRVLYYQRG